MPKMDDEALLSLLKLKEDEAAAYVHGILGQEREQALREYHRMPYGDEQEGWSTIVTSDVSDAVEWILPALLKTFSSTDKAVSFEPTRESDVKGAEQATDACNYVFYKQNNGFLVLYTALKDMLTVRNCAVMWRKETQDTVTSQPFKGASGEMLAMLLQEPESELDEDSVQQSPMLDQQGQPQIDMFGQPVMGYNGRIKKTEKKTIIKVEAFSPEDLLVEREWTSPLLQDCPYVARLMSVTLSELVNMGFDNVEAKDLRASDRLLSTRLHNINNQESELEDNDDYNDDSMATGILRIEYVLADADGDGVAERLCIYRLEDKILKREVVSHVPIATASPVLNPHRWDGQSVADLVSDIQKIHSELLRQTFNNLYLTNNPRTGVLTDSNGSPYADIEDLLNSRPGGIVRMKNADALRDIVTPFSAGASLPMLEYVKGMKEDRTGVSRTSMGLNPDSLNNTATGRQIDQTASMQRVELIARIVAETLIKPIFQGILKELTDGGMEKLAFRLRDEFVEYDPNEWRDSYDMTINVGLGTGDTQAKAQQLTLIHQMQMASMQMGLSTPKHLYHTSSKIIENAGFKDIQNFIQDPSKQPPQPPQPPIELQLAQMKQQGDAQKFQAQSQQDMQRFQAETSMQREVEQLKAQAQLQATQATLELQRANDERDAQREAMKAQYMQQAEQQRMELEQWKAQLQAQTQRQLKEMEIAGQIQVAQISAQLGLTQSSMAAQQAANQELTDGFERK